MLAQCLERDNWQLLDAVKENRVYILDSDIASGPRYLVGLSELAAWLYPDASVPSGKRIMRNGPMRHGCPCIRKMMVGKIDSSLFV